MKELEITDKPHHDDDLRIQHAQGVCDHAARFRPGYWMFVGPGSGKTWKYDKWEAEKPDGIWDRKALKMVQGTLKKKKEKGKHPFQRVPGDRQHDLLADLSQSIHFYILLAITRSWMTSWEGPSSKHRKATLRR